MRTFCGQGGRVYLITSDVDVHAFWCKKNSDFLKFVSCPQGYGRGGWASADIFRTRRGNFFAILCGRLLWSVLKMFLPNVKFSQNDISTETIKFSLVALKFVHTNTCRRLILFKLVFYKLSIIHGSRQRGASPPGFSYMILIK